MFSLDTDGKFPLCLVEGRQRVFLYSGHINQSQDKTLDALLGAAAVPV